MKAGAIVYCQRHIIASGWIDWIMSNLMKFSFLTIVSKQKGPSLICQWHICFCFVLNWLILVFMNILGYSLVIHLVGSQTHSGSSSPHPSSRSTHGMHCSPFDVKKWFFTISGIAINCKTVLLHTKFVFLVSKCINAILMLSKYMLSIGFFLINF